MPNYLSIDFTCSDSHGPLYTLTPERIVYHDDVSMIYGPDV